MNSRMTYALPYAVIVLCLCFLTSPPGFSQDLVQADSAINYLQNNPLDDQERLEVYRFIVSNSPSNQLDQIKKYSELGRDLAIELNEPERMAQFFYFEGFAFRTIGMPEKGLELLFEGAEYAISLEQYDWLSIIYEDVASCYNLIGDRANASLYIEKSLELIEHYESDYSLASQLINYGYWYYINNDYDSALAYYNKAEGIALELEDADQVKAYNIGNRALVYWKQGDLKQAKKDLLTAIESLWLIEDFYAISDYYIRLGNIFLEEEVYEKAEEYAEKGMIMAREEGYEEQLIDGYEVLSLIYQAQKKFEDALIYQELFISRKDSVQNLRNTQKLANLRTSFEVGQKQVEIDLLQAQKRSNQIIIIAGGILLFAIVILVIIILRSLRARTRFNQVLSRQKEDLARKAKSMEEANTQLRNTQSQLIHAEKMASLGELTAGIAHEIQNPLNFVNNFSDINREMLEELGEAIKNENLKEAAEVVIDLIDNESKITHHGKRAEQIVRSMLQHSRGSEGKKEPTDINALCDEYLRLAYHGLRAKDKSFKADYVLDLDEKLPPVNMVPQDIGRVLLNLINNAFQAVQGVENPEVVVSSKAFDDKIEFSVSDNGPGIPDELKEKIFQPFFTTKPTGQGTGLGLSMSYDIITKGHGGTISLTSQPEAGCCFKVTLPI